MNTVTVTGVMETNIVSSEDGKFTYETQRVFKNNKGEKGIIIQLYPTLCNEDALKLDFTSMHLLNHLEELNLGSIRFLNLFSKVTKGSRMSSRNLLVDEDNLSYIHQVMSEEEFKKSKLIIAWGSSMGSSSACNTSKRRILSMFYEYYPKGKLYQLSTEKLQLKNEIAPHLLFMGIRYGNSKWKLEELVISKEDYLIQENKSIKSK